ncbi:hypothetical protein BdPhPhi1402_gp25 [Bdellovibrio phage phi1402]|uniref:hypothetical protein n=1 Tax=Bdellovibrio phage phi1402 TaxID=1035662 RepID=UPI000211A2D7|nr:hypothetical protein BdPhPhi1402_gp25 [Bdellovibrio phage phi1402]AEG42322.1 hypothetical protein [Bdellovibrio phage phi1402]
MLNGIDPIIIFQFRKKESSELIGPRSPNGQFERTWTYGVPIISEIPTFVDQPPIPIYLSENVTGLFIDTETKNVAVGTTTETLTDGKTPRTIQKGASSTVSVALKAKADSVGLILFSAMIDLLLEKVTSEEYAITYMHGATTIFRGLLESYSVSEVSGTDLITINFELTSGEKDPEKVEATKPTISATPFSSLG